MEKFVVRAKMTTPVLFGKTSYLTLDALLATAIFRQTGCVDTAHKTIPLARTNECWHGSAAFFIDALKYSTKFLSSLHPSQFGERFDQVSGRIKIQRDQAPHKPDIDLLQGVECGELIWFGQGDSQKVHTLLSSLKGFGKKTNQGYGAFSTISVSPIKVDRSFVLPNGTPARPIPKNMWHQLNDQEATVIDAATFMPPYWGDSNSTLCVLPETRELTSAHIEHIDSGKVAKKVTIETNATFIPVDGRQFFYQHLGKSLSAMCGEPAPTKDVSKECNVCGSVEGLQKAERGYTTLCAVCYTIAGKYRNIKRPGRMGAGWIGLIAPTKSVLVTSVDYEPEEKPFLGFNGVELRCGKSELSKLLFEVMLDPPEPPFLFFYSGNSSVDVLRNLRVTYDARRLWICGSERACVNTQTICSAVENWRASGVPASKWLEAARLLTQIKTHIDVNSSFIRHLEEKYKKLEAKYDLSRIETMPLMTTEEYRWSATLINYESKEAR